ncbi:hypothetical protein [Streptomyces tendae]
MTDLMARRLTGEEPELLRVLAVAFERVWARAVPHDTYKIR